METQFPKHKVRTTLHPGDIRYILGGQTKVKVLVADRGQKKIKVEVLFPSPLIDIKLNPPRPKYALGQVVFICRACLYPFPRIKSME
jgi:hypothetical protein